MLKFEDNFPLSSVTTLQIGGPAKKFAAVKTAEELIEAIEYAKKQSMPYLIIGDGSNLLIADEGFNGLVIKNELSGIQQEGQTLTVKSGTILQDLVDYAINHSLAGLEKMTKIPGTVGGAVYGNAGAYGQSISDHLTQVVILGSEATPKAGEATPESDPGQARMTLSKEECQFEYRTSIFKQTKSPILEVTFQLETGDLESLQMTAKEITWKRFVKYPPGIKCPGSFFKNLVAAEIPPAILQKVPQEEIVYGKLPAAVLLDKVGAKGQSKDGITIASHHANLFINTGSGTAETFHNLAKKYALKVKEKFGITLEPEVQLVSLPPLI